MRGCGHGTAVLTEASQHIIGTDGPLVLTVHLYDVYNRRVRRVRG